MQPEVFTNPTLVFSKTIPTTVQTLVDYFTSIEAQNKMHTVFGNENVVYGDWEQYKGCRERSVTYAKCVTVPVLGKNVYGVCENWRVFETEGKTIIQLIIDLGTSPYADSFTPIVQVCVSKADDAVELNVNTEIVWKSTPFVKNIIQNTTLDESRGQYEQWYKHICEDILGESGADTDDKGKKSQSTRQEADEKFAKAKKIYKIAIIVLLLMCCTSILILNWPDDGISLTIKRIYKLCVALFFVFVMAYY